MFGCGYGSPDLTKVSGPGAVGFAVVFKMDLDGNILRLYQLGDAITYAPSGGGSAPTAYRDTCRAIAYDSARREVVAILEVTSSSLRTRYKTAASGKTVLALTDFSDTLILTMDDSGGLKKAYAINYGESRISTLIGSNSMFVMADGHYVWGGYSAGFGTKY
jgi:hypothetical protein